MAGRIFATAIALLLAAGGFFGGAPAPPNPLSPFGIVFLCLSGAIWFGWEMIQDAFAYRNEIRGKAAGRDELMLSRLAPLYYLLRRRKP